MTVEHRRSAYCARVTSAQPAGIEADETVKGHPRVDDLGVVAARRRESARFPQLVGWRARFAIVAITAIVVVLKRVGFVSRSRTGVAPRVGHTRG
jgi:hypothetical protein